MIIIFSAKNDFTTHEICKWLDFYQEDYNVVYSDFFLGLNNEISLEFVDLYLESIFKCPLKDIKVFWCRKWGVNSLLNTTNKALPLDLSEQLKGKSLKELNMFFEFIFNLLPEEKVINNFYDFKNTKLNQLLKAYECGLTIPKTYITNSKEQLTNIIEEKSSYITKAMYEGIGFNINEDSYTTYTSRININQFSSNIFLPSLVQKEITKKYEVRTFILGKKDYSMAIFSQGNRQTEVDYRQYDSSVPNKKAPFALPEMIKEKVLSLMDKMNLKTGSIDFIVDMDDNYYFLEINPYGQFGMVSIPNNYNLEHEFAKYLMEYE